MPALSNIQSSEFSGQSECFDTAPFGAAQRLVLRAGNIYSQAAVPASFVFRKLLNSC